MSEWLVFLTISLWCNLSGMCLGESVSVLWKRKERFWYGILVSCIGNVWEDSWVCRLLVELVFPTLPWYCIHNLLLFFHIMILYRDSVLHSRILRRV